MMQLPATLTGTVEHGKALGNTYDFPTANITPCEDVSDLPFGVYYSVLTVDGKDHPSITNLGVRPTVSDDNKVCAETSVYDADLDMYGKNITVTLLKFRRPEQRFSSVDELYATVADDHRAGRAWHGLPVT